MNEGDKTERQRRPGGRPLKYQTVEELDLAIQNYFAECDPHTATALVETGRDSKGNMLFDTRTVLTGQKPYTMSGLARAIGLSRHGLLDYSNKDEFSDSIREAKQRCEEYAESQLYRSFTNGAKFNLINNYRGKYHEWSDKQVLAGDPDAPLGDPLSGLTTDQLRKLAEDQPGGANTADQA